MDADLLLDVVDYCAYSFGVDKGAFASCSVEGVALLCLVAFDDSLCCHLF